MIWHVLNTGFRSGTFNMAFDEHLALQLKEGARPPTLRLYGWQPYALSMGFNQTREEFDIAKLDHKGIDIVRRPTGGRAILHAHELTYSIVMNSQEKSPKEIYRFISEGLLRGLQELGIDAHLTEGDDNFQKLYREPSSIPCFASSAKYEIQFEGKKLVGSAQRRYGTIVLQHGSLLLGSQHRRIVDFLAPHLQHTREMLEEDLQARTIEAETILGRNISFDEAAECITRGFELAWNISFVHEPAFMGETIAIS